MKRAFYVVLSIGIYLVFLTLVSQTRNYQCIDSSVVDKLDVIGSDQTLSAFSCHQRKSTQYSQALQPYIDDLEPRLNSLGLVLNDIDSGLFPVQIVIDETEPLKFALDVKSGFAKIHIGKALVVKNGHLEKAVIRAFLGRYLQQHQSWNLFDESMSDLIYFATYGRLDQADPMTDLKPMLGQARWPQVLQNLDHYCESPWRASQDYQTCASLSQQPYQRKQLMTMSLRPLVTSALIHVYQNLKLKEQSHFLKTIPEILKNRFIDPEIAIQYILTHDHSLQEGLSALKVFADQFSLKADPKNILMRRFVTQLNQFFESHGVSDSFAAAYFDVVVEFPAELDVDSELFKSLKVASQKNLNLQIAVKDKNQIWILPSQTGLSLQIFNQIKIRQHVFFACPLLKNIEMNEFVQTSEKLLLIRGCDSQKSYAFEALLSQGVADFTKQEPGLAFIQFHLPSLAHRIQDLQHVKNYFSLVQNRDINQPEFQRLGWQDIQWNDNYLFYKPKAAVDAIEFFRVETPIQAN